MKISSTMANMKKLQNLKYGIREPEIKDELYGINHHNIGCTEFKIVKLCNERKRVSDVLTETYKDLSLNSNFQPLCEAIKESQDQKYQKQIRECEAKNRAKCKELEKLVRIQHNQQKSAIYDADARIEGLRRKVKDAILTAEASSRYVGKRNQSNSEQHAIIIEEKEKALAARLKENKNKIDWEDRAHSEIELLNNIVLNETLEKVDEIMVQYEHDVEEMDLKIQNKRNQYQNMLNKRSEIEKEIADHAKEISEWTHFKDERQKLQAQQALMHKSAIVVQAWWRGMLVRLQLGPYKPKKGKFAKKKQE